MTIEDRIKEIEYRLTLDKQVAGEDISDITFLLSELKRCREGLKSILNVWCCQPGGCTYPTIDTAKHIAEIALHPEGVK